MPNRKIILALPPPARILLLILEVLFTLPLRIRSGYKIREGARGVVRVPRAGKLNAHSAARNFTQSTGKYTMVDGEEMTWHTRRCGGVTRE